MSNLPFKAYEGADEYIFISYAHKNSEKVFPIIKQLHDMGYRIWYDEGIDPGTEWPESIAEHLSKAAAVMLFITPESMDSDNVRREITFALNFRKLMLSIYLTPTEISAGMLLQLGLNQAIHYYTYETDELFFEKLLKVVPEAILDKNASMTAVSNKNNHTQNSSLPEESYSSPASIKLNATVPEIITDNANKEQTLKFDSSIIIPFMPTGTATITLKNETVLEIPLNTLIVPRNDGNFAGISFHNKLTEEIYRYGADENFYSFQNMKSFEVSVLENNDHKLGVIMYMADGTRFYHENYSDFTLGMLAGKSYKTISMSEIKSVEFDKDKLLKTPVDLALLTTTDGISFYMPLVMLAWSDIHTSNGIPFRVRTQNINLGNLEIEFRRFKSFQINREPNEGHNTKLKLSFELKSGLREETATSMYYLPSLIGINQYGCFSLSITQLARIDIFGSQSESAPAPTPLPYIKWPEVKNDKKRFYGEGLAEITTLSGKKYQCPANSVYALEIQFRGGLIPYTNINKTIKEGKVPVFGGYTNDICTPFSEISAIRMMNHISGSDYQIEIEDIFGNNVSGTTGFVKSNICPSFVFPQKGKQGYIRLVDLKEICFDHDAEAPKIETSTVYTKEGNILSIAKGSITFSSYSSSSSSCFRLPTGNFIETNRLRRMMITENKVSENEIQNWIVFECDGFSGAFPLVDANSFQIYAMDSLGLRKLKPGSGWTLINVD
ncbi:MAG: toll/interleukin-1 receptor domain-containing protein [Dysgonamonadaceae bacterium]|jgi:hypothetical protein|nr:toll/interleukin-1 receptor domain-containing protein [Dysgonamonadaceae bacterium]